MLNFCSECNKEAKNIISCFHTNIPNDIIMLQDGLHTGEGNIGLLVSGKSLTIQSISGSAAACVIDCGGVRPAVSRNVGARSVRLTKSSIVRPPETRLGQRMASGIRVPRS